MDIDSASPIALYLQIANYFRDLVQKKHLSPGDRLPTESNLAERYNVSRGTVRQAMRILENEGLIERAPGKGTFIKQKYDLSAPLIGVILPTMRDEFAINILTGIEQTAKKRAYQIVFAQTQEQIEQEETDIERMREQDVAGFLLFPISNMNRDPLIEQLVRENVPLVLMDRYLPGLEVDVVTCDNVGGGRMATEHLIKLGHKRIGFVASSSTVTSSIRDRFQGYQDVLREHALPYDEATDFCLVDDLDAFLSSPHRPSAIFTTNDFTAISLLQTAEKRGVRIPEDLALVSFDNIKQAAHLRVPLTTVAQSGQRIGERACKILLERLSGDNRPPRHEALPVYLVVRESCGAGRKGGS